MATDQWEIRLVRQLDNHVLALVLRDVLIEMNVPKQGTAFADPELTRACRLARAIRIAGGIRKLRRM